MIIHQIYTNGPLRNFSYLIEGESSLYAIDPYDLKLFSPLLKEKELIGILNTHEHGDHTCGNLELQKATGAKVYAHAQARVPGKTDTLRDGDFLDLGEGAVLKILATPGHSNSDLSFFLESPKIKAIFTGDILFNAGVGNCYNGGDPKTLYDTISKVFSQLKPDVRIYPGHDYLINNLNFCLSLEKTNSKVLELRDYWTKKIKKDEFFVSDIGTEKLINAFLRLDSNEIREELNMVDRSDQDVFLALRSLRNKW